MLELDDVIGFWNTYQDTHEGKLNDYQLQIVSSTVRHLLDYRKLKTSVYPSMLKTERIPDNELPSSQPTPRRRNP